MKTEHRWQRWALPLLLIPVWIAIGGGLIMLGERYLAGLILMPVLLGIGLLWASVIVPHAERTWLLKLFLFSLVLHFCTSFVIEFVWPSFESISDGAAYGPHAATIATAWHTRGFVTYADVVPVPVSAAGYVYFSAALYWLIGYNTLFIKLINGLFASLSILYTYKIANRLFDGQVARRSALITALMPSILLWTSQNLKDSSVLLLSLWGFWEALQVARNRLPRLGMLALIILLLSTVRIETALGMAVIFSSTLMFQSRGHFIWRLALSALALILIGWGLQRAGYGFLGSDVLSTRLSIDAINAKRTATAYGGSAIDPGPKINSLGGLIAYLPLALANFLLRPWPWEATGSALQLATIPESLFIWYPLFGLALLGLIHVLRTQLIHTAMLWSYIIGATIAAAPQYGNLGTAYRHRVQLWPFYFILASVGWQVWRRWRERVRQSKPLAAQQRPLRG